ncbi:hypothetical protein AX16_001973 [Volvariella volvacea WC 439]|nr:hypothetical protein AX16_001973 [Volvariella volvacea WC 439]
MLVALRLRSIALLVSKQAQSPLLAGPALSLRARVPLLSISRSLSQRSGSQSPFRETEQLDSRVTRKQFGRDNIPRSFREPVPPSQNLYIGNIPYSVGEEELRELFSQYGQITSVRVAYTPEGESKGFAHIQFKNRKSAIDAFEAQPIELVNRRLRVDYAHARPPMKRKAFHTLFLSDFWGDEVALRAAFGENAVHIDQVLFFKNPETSEPTGRGLVRFSDVSHATQALEHYLASGGSQFNLSYARNNDQPPNARRRQDRSVEDSPSD